MIRTSFSRPLLILFMVFFISQTVQADDLTGIGAGGKISTIGVGAEAVGNVFDNLNLRIGFQGFKYGYDDRYKGIEYRAEMKFISGMLLADLFPFNNNFRISGGIMPNNNELTLEGRPTNSKYEIGDSVYPSALVGDLTGTIDFNTVAPYLGLGYGGYFTDSRKFSFMIDVGVLYHGSPNVTYTASGILKDDPVFQANLEQERLELEEDLEDLKFYPVLSMGLIYNF